MMHIQNFQVRTHSMTQIESLEPLAISVDVEEYFHAANLASACPIKSWSDLPSRVAYSTKRLLDFFDAYNVKGTFFVLGYCAKREPSMVREIVSRGHELASHGFAHKIAYLQNEKQFYRDIKRSKDLLEDTAGVVVDGYRAPNFSIRDQNLWAYDLIKKAGYRYDSSLYPVYHDRYGNPHRSMVPEVRNTAYGPLLILPLTLFRANILGRDMRIPTAGGAYWRIFPKLFIKYALNRAQKESKGPVICYLHPWEIDGEQPYFDSLTASQKLRHYIGLRTFEKRISYFMQHFSFIPIRDAAKELIEKIVS
jgi:polysaccharide deacetylase family protein (PEP-CTERM system associated)